MKFMDKLKSIKKFGEESNGASEGEYKDATDPKEQAKGCSSSPSLLLTSTVTASGSSEQSAADIDMIDFTISIEAIDGIIMTSSTTANIVRLANPKKAKDDRQRLPPVFGLVTYQQSVGAHSEHKTNIPSRPLVKSKSSIGKRERYCASFGSSSRYKKNSDKKLEQIKMTMPMRKSKSRPSGYVEKQLDLCVGLMRESEVIKLGLASVPLYGDEYDESKLIPVVQQEKEKALTATRMYKNRSLSRKPKTILGVKSVYFPSDPSRKYSIQCANLRLSIKANYRPAPKPTILQRILVTDERSIFSRFLPIGKDSDISVKVVPSTEEGASGFEMVERDQSSLSFRDSLLENNTRVSMSLSGDRSPIVSKDDDDSSAASSHESVETEEEDRSIFTYVSNDDSSGVSYTDEDSHYCDETTTLGEESTLVDNVSLGTIKKFRELGYGQQTYRGI